MAKMKIRQSGSGKAGSGREGTGLLSHHTAKIGWTLTRNVACILKSARICLPTYEHRAFPGERRVSPLAIGINIVPENMADELALDVHSLSMPDQ